jgi:hypothetical protein
VKEWLPIWTCVFSATIKAHLVSYVTASTIKLLLFLSSSQLRKCFNHKKKMITHIKNRRKTKKGVPVTAGEEEHLEIKIEKSELSQISVSVSSGWNPILPSSL